MQTRGNLGSVTASPSLHFFRDTHPSFASCFCATCCARSARTTPVTWHLQCVPKCPNALSVLSVLIASEIMRAAREEELAPKDPIGIRGLGSASFLFSRLQVAVKGATKCYSRYW